jgi:hypothetical protein
MIPAEPDGQGPISKTLPRDLPNKRDLRRSFKKEEKDSCRAGVDVMITILCDFRQFSAKKSAFFSQTNVMIKIVHLV